MTHTIRNQIREPYTNQGLGVTVLAKKSKENNKLSFDGNYANWNRSRVKVIIILFRIHETSSNIVVVKTVNKINIY